MILENGNPQTKSCDSGIVVLSKHSSEQMGAMKMTQKCCTKFEASLKSQMGHWTPKKHDYWVSLPILLSYARKATIGTLLATVLFEGMTGTPPDSQRVYSSLCWPTGMLHKLNESMQYKCDQKLSYAIRINRASVEFTNGTDRLRLKATWLYGYELYHIN